MECAVDEIRIDSRRQQTNPAMLRSLMLSKANKKGHLSDHPENGFVAHIIPAWPSNFGTAVAADLQPQDKSVRICQKT